MPRRESKPPARLSSARLSWLRKQLKAVQGDHTEAKKDRSWSAVAALRRQMQALRLELDNEVIRLEDARALAEREAAAAVELTPEERATQMAQSALKATDDELEIFVSEWLGRIKYDLRVDDAGVLKLERQGLRLIG